ncbi:hypothetical protein GOP47_0016150 [Adiantum capillus-veneris]|uniref:Uncharacterized protein n=1 Tax=Adiantum capillus-veneris TaxID=13818 RepID=A0A9D4ZC90_ADICA|nr:hypothetical protein GOP47_0016150 [Adiantum capillus-veneris]
MNSEPDVAALVLRTVYDLSSSMCHSRLAPAHHSLGSARNSLDAAGFLQDEAIIACHVCSQNFVQDGAIIACQVSGWNLSPALLTALRLALLTALSPALLTALLPWTFDGWEWSWSPRGSSYYGGMVTSRPFPTPSMA